MKRVFLVSICLILISNLHGQKIDQIILKSGSIIRGNIASIEPEGNVIIDDLSGNTWVFSMTEVKKIEEVANEWNNLNNQELRFNVGFMNTTTFGVLAGSRNSYDIAPFSIMNSTGYVNGYGIYTGFSFGMEYLNINHIPLMADIQYFLSENDVAPILILKGGYEMPVKFFEEQYSTRIRYKGGPTFAAGMGVKIKTKEHFAWDVSILYRYVKVTHTENYSHVDNLATYTDIYNRLELRVGFNFGK